MPVLIFLLLLLIPDGAISMGNENGPPEGRNRYFDSPETAIPAITELLQSEDFKTLASYYDLAGSDLDRVDLESGEYFIRKQPPPSAHPGGFWRYRHPFAPGFRFSHITSGIREGSHVVHMKIVIGQGEGLPPQIGFSSFAMIRSEKGWQILPGLPAESDFAKPMTIESHTDTGQ